MQVIGKNIATCSNRAGDKNDQMKYCSSEINVDTELLFNGILFALKYSRYLEEFKFRTVVNYILKQA